MDYNNSVHLYRFSVCTKVSNPLFCHDCLFCLFQPFPRQSTASIVGRDSLIILGSDVMLAKSIKRLHGATYVAIPFLIKALYQPTSVVAECKTHTQNEFLF